MRACFSDGNLQALSGAGLRFIVGQKIPEVPYIVREWLKTHSGQQPPDGLTLTQPWSRGPAGAAVTETIYYQYRASRARRTLRGISEQVSKAERVVAGKIPVKRNRFITLTGAQKSVNRDLEAKAKALAGWKGYITNLADPRPEYVIGAYHQLWQIEKSFRMSKSDLKARPIHHHLKDSIEAYLTIVFAALAVARWLEATTKVSLKTPVKTLRRYRTIDIQTWLDAIVTTEDPIPNNTQTWLNAIHNTQEQHQMNQVRAQLAEYKKSKPNCVRPERGIDFKDKAAAFLHSGSPGKEHDTRTPHRQGRQPPRNPCNVPPSGRCHIQAATPWHNKGHAGNPHSTVKDSTIFVTRPPRASSKQTHLLETGPQSLGTRVA